MRKNTFTGIVVAAMLVVAGGVLPSVTSAQSISFDQLQVQINALLEQVRILQNQLSTLQINIPTPSVGHSVPPAVVPPPPIQPVVSPVRHRVCSALYRDLVQGVQGDDVRSLQEFLQSQGHLAAEPTGLFGTTTSQAVLWWQLGEGITVVGSFGPVSRERIRRWCGGGTVVSNRLLTATPTSGQAPLTVNFDAHVSITNPQMVADMGRYKIRFGDGAEQVFTCTWALPQCTGPQYASHIYAENGTYTASLIHFGYFGPVGDPPEQIMESVVINVGSQMQMCTMEYSPVCGSKPIVCGPTHCPINPVQQTYSNSCAMQADGATLSYEGACRPTSTVPPVVQTPLRPRACMALYRNLVKGARGDDVRSLQEFLQSQGLLTAEPTGFFGALTSQAVSQWQTSQGISPAGSFGPLSRKHIRMLCGGTAVSNQLLTATPPVQPVVQTPLRPRACMALYRNLVKGARGDDVRSLQEFLQSQGHLTANPTGFFGALTSQAVSQWQTSQGISPAGSFGPLSRKHIRMLCGGTAVSNQPLDTQSPPYGPQPSGSEAGSDAPGGPGDSTGGNDPGDSTGDGVGM